MFILDRPASSEETHIFLFYKRFKYSTGKKIHPSRWNTNTRRPKYDKELSKILSQIEQAIEATENPDTDEIKRIVDKYARLIDPSAEGFFAAADTVIEAMKTGDILTDKKKKYSYGTLRNYRLTKSILFQFDPKLSFEKIDLKTYKKFLSWCTEKDYTLNFTGAQVKNFKGLIKHAHGLGLHSNKIFNDPEFKIISEETFDIYLSEKELKRLASVDLSAIPALSLARDWFLLGCYAGLRVNDLFLVNAKNISKDYITIANEKTDVKVVIPLHPVVRKILKKYEGIPKAISDVELNRSIKKVAKLCKINEKVLYSVTKGGKRKDYYLEKWEMVSAHTCRRSFITNLLKSGVPNVKVMKLAGIKKEATLMRYYKQTVEEVAYEMKDHPFFRTG